MENGTKKEIPQVSIVCLTYNHERYIAKTLEGFLNQKTNFPFEIIVHEDASKDSTAEIVRKYESLRPDLFFNIYQTKNKFTDKNVNIWTDLTFPKARGKYIVMCEGDDYWTNPDKLQIQFDFLEANPEYVIHTGHAEVIDKEGNKIRESVHPVYGHPVTYELNDFLLDSKISTCTTMFRNIGLDKMPAIFSKVTSSDWFLWLYLMNFTGKKVYFANEFFAAYRIHSAGAYNGLSTIENYRYYIKNLKYVDSYLNESEKSKIIREKAHWFEIELFRELLKNNQKREALKQLFHLMCLNLGLRTKIRLISEYRNHRIIN